MDGESKDGGRLRQFFVHGHGGGPVEEQMRPSLQSAGMGVTLKRKEPECGWEPNMIILGLVAGMKNIVAGMKNNVAMN
ncbi:hypothetical protein AAC387_Pa03g1174 [Persea americana]